MSENEIKPVYPKIDHMQLDADGGYYCRHVAAMTDEGLHKKSDIAGQLGMRDREIDRLTAERDEAQRKLSVAVAEGKALVAERDSTVAELASARERLSIANEVLMEKGDEAVPYNPFARRD